MSSFLQQELGVAMSGVKWDIGNFKLWQSQDPNVILFMPKQPSLAIGQDGRYQVAVSQYRQQKDKTYKITGGSAMFTVTSALQYKPAAMDKLIAEWRRHINDMGGAKTKNPKFVPLNTQKGEATVLINPLAGKANVAHNQKAVGTPGGTTSFLLELTSLGAQEWVQGIKEKKRIPAGLKMMYEYLRLMPKVGARVSLVGEKVFKHFSMSASVSVDAFWYGGSAKIDAAWEEMQRNGAIKVEFIGQLPPELESIRTEMVSTFASQAQAAWFKILFEPAPQVPPAQAGDTSGLFGGANFAFKWKKATDAVNLTQEISFTGWTWLKASMDAEVGTLFSKLDSSYVTEVNAELSSPAALVVDSDEMLEKVAVSWSAEGHGVESPVFGAEGGVESYVITSKNLDKVNVKYTAKVDFVPSKWPIIETSGAATIAKGGNQVVIKPSAWVGRNYIYMFVREGDEIKMVDLENDYLVCNVSYSGPHLKNPIKDSARITPDTPLEFAYPLSPDGRRGTAKFSAFGVIGGKLVRSKERTISFDEESVFILASSTDIQLVSKESVLPEDDDLAARLLASAGRPVVRHLDPETGEENGSSVDEPSRENGHADETSRENGHEEELEGTAVAVEYGFQGAYLWVLTDGGERKRVQLRDSEEADRFDDSKKRVRVSVDPATSVATNIVVELQ